LPDESACKIQIYHLGIRWLDFNTFAGSMWTKSTWSPSFKKWMFNQTQQYDLYDDKLNNNWLSKDFFLHIMHSSELWPLSLIFLHTIFFNNAVIIKSRKELFEQGFSICTRIHPRFYLVLRMRVILFLSPAKDLFQICKNLMQKFTQSDSNFAFNCKRKATTYEFLCRETRPEKWYRISHH